MLGKITKGFLYLLPVALMTSMAAMEFVSWFLFLLFLVHLGKDIFEHRGLKNFRCLALGKVDYLLWGFFLVVALGALTMLNEKVVDTIGDTRWILLLYGYVYLLTKYFNEKAVRYVGVFAGVVSLVGILSLLQFYWGIDITRKRDILANFGGFHRASGFFNHPLTFAYSIGMAGLVLGGHTAMGAIRGENFKKSWLKWMGTVMGTIGLIVSLSRGAWAAYVFAGVTLLWKVKRIWAVSALILAICCAGVLFQTNETIRKRLESLTTIEQNESNRLRTVLWAANWQIFKENPVIGVGFGHSRRHLQAHYDKNNITEPTIISHAHNNYLEILSGTGVLGFLFYMGFCLYFLALALMLFQQLDPGNLFFRGLTLGIFAAQIHLHLGGLTQCNFTDGEVTHLTVFLWALLIVIQRKESLPGLSRKH